MKASPTILSNTVRTDAVALACILTLALALRLIALHAWKHSLYADFLVYDEKTYHDWALHILRGQGGSVAIYDFSPLPAYLIAGVYGLFSPNPDILRGINIILGTATCFFVYAIGRHLAGRRVGLVSAGIAALYKPLIFFSITIMKTSLGICLFAAVIWLILKVMEAVTFSRIAALGITLGLLIQVRSNSGALLLAAAAAIAWASLREPGRRRYAIPGIVVLAAGLAAVSAPFALRSLRQGCGLSIVPLGGFNFYLANNRQNPYPFYRPVSFATSVPSQQAAHFVMEASYRVGQKLSPGQASSFWVRQSFREAANAPLLFVSRLGYKVLAMFSRFESADNYHLGFLSRFVPFFRLPFVDYWMVLPFGVAGMMRLWRRSPAASVVAATALLYAATLVIFFVNIRLRLPLAILFLPFSVWGIGDLAAGIRQRERARTAAYALAAAAVFLAGFIPTPGAGDLSGHYNTHARLLATKGRLGEAAVFWEQSSSMNRSYSAYADLALARLHLQHDRPDAAIARLDRIADNSFAAAEKFEMTGDIYSRKANQGEAAAQYRKALAVMAAKVTVDRKLIRIYGAIDPRQAVEQRRRLEKMLSYDPR